MPKVNPDSPTLQNNQAESFHLIFEKLLRTTKWAHPDIETAVAFLCTRVKSPIEQHKNKPKIMLKFLNQTIDDKIVIGAGFLRYNLTWIDASYAVQP